MKKAPKQKPKGYQDGGTTGSKKMTPAEWDAYNKSKGFVLDPRNPMNAKGYGVFYDTSQIAINPSKAHESGYEVIGKKPGAVDAFGVPLASAFSTYSYNPATTPITPSGPQKPIVDPGHKPIDFSSPFQTIYPNGAMTAPGTTNTILPIPKKNGGKIKGYDNGGWVDAKGNPIDPNAMNYSDADKAALGYKKVSGSNGMGASGALLAGANGAVQGASQGDILGGLNKGATSALQSAGPEGQALAAGMALSGAAGQAVAANVDKKDDYGRSKNLQGAMEGGAAKAFSQAPYLGPTALAYGAIQGGIQAEKDIKNREKQAGEESTADAIAKRALGDTDAVGKSSISQSQLNSDVNSQNSVFGKAMNFSNKLTGNRLFAEGGGIHINPAHKGMFTAYKERTGKTTEEALHSDDPHVRKMAQFAINASKWNHKAEGGKIVGPGTGKSDSIKAKMKEGSFIVPVENAKLAENIRATVLKKAPNKKANLNQKNGTDVLLSNGEHEFSKEEVAELKKYGIDVDALAPNSDDKKAMKSGGLTPEKAHEILKDGTIGGKPITDKQRKYFGWIYSKGKAEGGLLYGDGGRVRLPNETAQQYVARMKELDKQEGQNKTTQSKTTQVKRAPVRTKYDPLPDLATREVRLPINDEASGAGGLLGQTKDVPLGGAGQITSKEANQAAVNSPQTVIPKTNKVDWTNALEYGASAGQIALGLDQLRKSKRPVYSMDKTFESNVNKALANAQFGYTPEQQFMLDQQNQGLTNQGRFDARNYSGGSASNALANERSVLNDANMRNINTVVGGQQLQQSKQARADALLADKMAIQRQIFSDSLNAFNQKQQSGSALLGAGIRNLIGANRVQQELAAQEKAANLSNSWMGNI